MEDNDIFNVTDIYDVDTIALGQTTSPGVGVQIAMNSTTQGLLLPRMTTAQRTGIAGGLPPEGLFVYDTTTESLWFFNGSSTWIELAVVTP